VHKSSVLTSNSWKDKDLTWQLIHCIAEDPIIRQGLFPCPGANVLTAKGGGLSKAHHHKELAARVFGDHLVYGPAFEQARTAKEKNLWAQKIKNRIQAWVGNLFSQGSESHHQTSYRLVKDTQKYKEEMGLTGEGITSADQINMDVKNAFTNKWGQ